MSAVTNHVQGGEATHSMQLTQRPGCTRTSPPCVPATTSRPPAASCRQCTAPLCCEWSEA